MPAQAFVDRLNEQVGHEFAASQQYLAIAVYYDDETLPRLAAFFYAQALEERNHALMMIQYLLDAGREAPIPGRAGRRRRPLAPRPRAAPYSRDRARPLTHRRRAPALPPRLGDAAARGAHRQPRRGPLVRRRRLHVDDRRRAVLRRRGRRRGIG